MPNLSNYISAARPKTLPLAIAGPLLAISIAIFEQGSISILTAVLALTTAILLQILSNFSNDLGDFQKGTDQAAQRTDRALSSGNISEKNMKWAVAYIAILALITGVCLLIISIHTWKEGLVLLLLGLGAIAAAITYTMGKKAYGYFGFGDLFVFIFFGLVSVVATYYLLTKDLHYTIWIAGIAMGCFSIMVLNINNIRDLEKDKIAYKNTIPVWLGFGKSRVYHILLAAVASIIMLNLLIHYNTPFLGVMMFALLLVLHQFLGLEQKNYKEFNDQLKYTSLTILGMSIAFFIHSLVYYFSQ